MFPTSGYFSNLTCPYFLKDRCDRPYCHFSHQTLNRPYSRDVSSYVKTTLELTGLNYIPTPKNEPKPSTSLSYKPTPLSKLNHIKTGNISPQENKKKNAVEGEGRQVAEVKESSSEHKLTKHSLAVSKLNGLKEHEIVASKKNAKDLIIEKPNKKKLKELEELFGEDSDAESVDTASSNLNGDVVDLTADSESDSESHSCEQSSLSKISRTDTVSCRKQDEAKQEKGSSVTGHNSDKKSIGSTEEDQCRQLFNMFKEKECRVVLPKCSVSEEAPTKKEEYGRKRVARQAPESVTTAKRPMTKKLILPSPHQVLQARFEAARAAGTTKIVENTQKNSQTDTTFARTYKDTERKAHIPQSKKVQKSFERPRIPVSSRGKVAANVRQSRLDAIVEECLKLYTDEQDAFTRAKSEEESVNTRATSKAIYLNLAANVIKKLRHEQSSKNGLPGSTPSAVSHDIILAGKAASSITVGLKRKLTSSKEDMTGDLLFKKLRPYQLTESQLKEHGFPRSDPKKHGNALITWTDYDKVPVIKDNVRKCKRCSKDFLLNSQGAYVKQEDCVYHWGKVITKKVHGSIEKLFLCCEGKPGSEGCSISNNHVHETNKFHDLSGYMKTFTKNNKDHCAVYALDCEMVYTVAGIDVARVTVVDDHLNVILDSFIKPKSAILDYNTRFSGLTEEHFKDVDATLTEVQAILLDIFEQDTILIGHSLNSDLVALKLIHDTVVDTSVVFPHKLGPPYKRALKFLMQDILNKLIQEAGDEGHNSAEDASACMELMKWKIHQDFMKDNR